jgi:hypothetical protein
MSVPRMTSVMPMTPMARLLALDGRFGNAALWPLR